MFIPRLIGRSIPKSQHSRYQYFARLEKLRYIHTTNSTWATRKTLQKFNLADIGEGITECEIVKWSIQPNTPIAAFDPLCEVQSDKASVEITSPFDGILKEIMVQEGEVAKVGSALCVIEVEEEVDESVAALTGASTSGSGSAASSSSSSETTTTTTTSAEQAKPTHQDDISATTSRSERRMHPLDPNNTQRQQPSYGQPALSHSHSRSRAQFESSNSTGTSTSNTTSTSQPLQEKTPVSSDLVFATPAVRFYAKERGVDLGYVAPGSGREGRVEMSDVDRYIERGVAAAAAAEAQAQAQGGQQQQQQQQEEDMVVELGRTRYGMWKAMVKSLEVPHFGYTTHLDITELHNLLPVLNANIPAQYLPSSARHKSANPANRLVNPSALVMSPLDRALLNENELAPHEQITRLTYLPFLLKTLAKAMHEWPIFRSSITPGSGPTLESPTAKPTLSVRPTSDITVALSTPTGLYTPTIGNVGSQSVYGIASALGRLSYLGRQVPCALGMKEMPRRGGTVSVSNVGAVGMGRDANPVLVNGGGVAIVAIGRAEWVWDVDRFWVEGSGGEGGRGERRLRVPVSWSADHRVVEGAELAAFVESWRGWVENPVKMIGEAV